MCSNNDILYFRKIKFLTLRSIAVGVVDGFADPM